MKLLTELFILCATACVMSWVVFRLAVNLGESFKNYYGF